jgi:hypothetical protein
VEDYRRNELADALATGDLASAQATCASQVKFYRNLGDENAAAAWNDAFASVIDLKRSGAPSSGMDKVAEGVMEKLYLSAGTPEHIASSSVDYAEAQKATASHYMNNAMQRVEEVLSKIPPPETPKKRSGEEPPKSPPEVPPSNAPAPSLARKATPAGKKG